MFDDVGTTVAGAIAGRSNCLAGDVITTIVRPFCWPFGDVTRLTIGRADSSITFGTFTVVTVALLICGVRNGVFGTGIRDGVFGFDFILAGFCGVDTPRMGGRESIRLRL